MTRSPSRHINDLLRGDVLSYTDGLVDKKKFAVVISRSEFNQQSDHVVALQIMSSPGSRLFHNDIDTSSTKGLSMSICCDSPLTISNNTYSLQIEPIEISTEVLNDSLEKLSVIIE